MSDLETPELKFAESNGVPIAVWEWPGEGPPLVFAHATGFHGRCWDAIARRFPGRRRLALEFRGHGRSGKPAPPYCWRWFGEDVAAVARQFGLRGAIGIGHSMGGHALASGEAARNGAFAALLLIDPVIFPPQHYGVPHPPVDFIRRRRAQWRGADEMFAAYRNRRPFSGWDLDVFRDYCDFALLPDGGGFTLACPPEVEASIYDASYAPESNIYAGLAEVKIPVTVMRADAQPEPGIFDLASSPTWPGLATAFPNGRDMPLAGRNHYIPMEAPALVAEEIGNILLSKSAWG
jgi:lipase